MYLYWLKYYDLNSHDVPLQYHFNSIITVEKKKLTYKALNITIILFVLHFHMAGKILI